ncbi:MAG: AraC family transcriptional regulator [Rhizobiaceae bacterium]|nr:AraC family transcriptional regulator [Rhizobiaceae bacterium]
MEKSFDAAYQRAGPLSQACDLLKEFGVNGKDIGERVGIDLEYLSPDSRVPFEACLLFLELCVQRTGCEHFGLLLGSRYAWKSHGIIQRLANEAPSLRIALQDFEAWQLGYASGAAVYLHRHGSDFAFGYGVYDRASYGSRQLYDLCAAVGCNMLQDLTGGRVSPIEICFHYDAPVNIIPYQRILNAPLRFNQDQFCLVIPGERIDEPRPDADPLRRQHILCEINAALGRTTNKLSARVKHLIRPQLLMGDPSMEGIARLLGMPSRTLRRRLAAEGTTFERIRDDVRYAAARELLDLTDVGLGEISAALAFASHSTFTQAFSRWSGASPAIWRQHLKQGVQGGKMQL